jgi:predicted metal-dependent hydrolase
MKRLVQQTEIGEVPVNWCNADPVTSSVMEAVSFVTPVLENFFIRTVVEGTRTHRDEELVQRCQAFIREESNHSCVHKKFNSSLLQHLGKQPPALAMVGALLNVAARRLSLSKRLALAAALEHLAAVISKLYVNQQPKLIFTSSFAQELFEMHAREELAHRSVVFDLWLANGASSRINRIVTIALVLLTGAAYVSIAVPWILHRKTGRKFTKTLAGLGSFVAKNFRDTLTHTPLVELLSFVRRDYHPESLVDDAHASGV